MNELPLAKITSAEDGDPKRERVVSALYKGHDLDLDPQYQQETNNAQLETAASLPLPSTPKAETSDPIIRAPDIAVRPEKEYHASTSSLSSYASAQDKKDTAVTDLEAQDSSSGTKDSSSEVGEKTKDAPASPDPNLVDFDGPDDPANARNWSSRKKWFNIAIIAACTFLTPLASSMFAPGVPAVMRDFKSDSPTLASFVVSVYILGYVFGPMILAPLSELYGRVPVYHGSNICFCVFTIACALAKDLNMLIGFRFVEGLFGSCPLTIGGGTIADMFVQEKRGGVMAIWALGPLMGPVIGPVAGGYLSAAAGWRWVFWVIAIASGVFTISGFICLRETYAVTILERKARRLRKETGNADLHSKMALPYTPLQLIKVSIARPLKMLLFSPIVLFLSLYVAIVYGYLYLLFTTLTLVFETKYHFSSGSVGLTFLGIGVGSMVGIAVFGFGSDRLLKHLTAKNGGAPKPEYRLPPMIPGSLFIPLGLFLYGWTAQNASHIHWIAPIIGTSLVGFGLLATFMPVQTYLVDAYTVYAASAMAANTIFRSLFGALLPLAGRSMYEKLGLGWGNSLLGFVALACLPIPVWLWFYGERVRMSKKWNVRFD